MTGEVSQAFESVETLLRELDQISKLIQSRYQGLYLDRLASFQRKVKMFGFHFASLDIRQDSRVIQRTLESALKTLPDNFYEQFKALSEAEQTDALLNLDQEVEPASLSDPVETDTLESMRLIQEIQRKNGEQSIHRYIISNCRGPRDIVHVIALFRLAGWKSGLSVDIVPLFETIDDLKTADQTMSELYENRLYDQHLRGRARQQTVMLGFSDGTKDGGYLMANWAIYCAKEAITTVSRNVGVKVTFFDGRGGPQPEEVETPIIYAALGKEIENTQIHLTVQGQTISSYYGTDTAARHNLNQLLAAGLKAICSIALRESLTVAAKADSASRYHQLREVSRVQITSIVLALSGRDEHAALLRAVKHRQQAGKKRSG